MITMKMNRSTTIVDYKLVTSFRDLQQRLRAPGFSDRLERPLVHWARLSDRRLPLAFLKHTVGELLSRSFDELCATPGVGRKKIRSLLELLERVAVEPLAASSTSPVEPARAAATPPDLADLSEGLWQQWRETVAASGLGQQTLGRHSASLQDLPRVIWHAPLDAYTGLSLEELRSLKTHGEKRVRVVLETFGALFAILSPVHTARHLSVRIVPRFSVQIEAWLARTGERTEEPSARAVLEGFVRPLLEQLRCDAGDQIADLAAGRLGLAGRPITAIESARELGLTRARVYQLLGDAGAVMAVRWPEGRAQVNALRVQLAERFGSSHALQTLSATADLFFPTNQPIGARGDSGPRRTVKIKLAASRVAS